MTNANPRAVIGANNPPDPIDAINAAYTSAREEAENWLDGSPVENEAQMKAVDALRADARQWRMDLEKGQKSAAAPLHDAWKAELERWKPTIADAKAIEGGLVAAVDGFKRKLAEQREAEQRAARAEAERKTREAAEAARKVNAADIEATREAARLQAEAESAQKAAAIASNATVKGLRTVTRYDVIDAVKLARHLWEHDREAQLEFQADRARKLGLNIPGVFEQRKEKVAS